MFFGVSKKDKASLAKLLERYYNPKLISEIIDYVCLKKVSLEGLMHWQTIQKRDLSSDMITNIIRSLRENGRRAILPKEFELMTSIIELLENREIVYYGGHQFKLGHYFRHLFQSVKYINMQKILSYDEKYDYIKTLRAQLSTVEQYMIFYNSLSFMGREWEINHVNVTEDNLQAQLLSKYNFIKNIPDLMPLNDINIISYYPDIHFEFEERAPGRNLIEEKFRELDILNQ